MFKAINFLRKYGVCTLRTNTDAEEMIFTHLHGPYQMKLYVNVIKNNYALPRDKLYEKSVELTIFFMKPQ